MAEKQAADREYGMWIEDRHALSAGKHHHHHRHKHYRDSDSDGMSADAIKSAEDPYRKIEHDLLIDKRLGKIASEDHYDYYEPRHYSAEEADDHL